ncbi:probable LRR receptor-like serine/threonine-protein kinase At3g47570 [Triticum urartu]|uniref:probable LRR receptor-like serine/threonine-protein kinase At3g47570 n=1 Tax=Triticum urartu TaxID=4572 RepID=UPI0020438556|nr:probable LRR receptor-like serine/threonine-protein kinase At3g47570 [Triticum urartu]
MAGMRAVRLLLSSLLFALVIAAARDSVSNHGDDDGAALLAFKAGITSGRSSGPLSSWNSSTSFCSWEGVTCGGSSGRVVALDLSSRGLAGTLLAAIGNLTSLQTLNLSFNWFHGSIPASLGHLRRLHTLDLSDNSLSGMLPDNMSLCTGMTALVLGSNKLGGLIPSSLGDTLTNLKKLSLTNNSFTGAVPASLANLSSLQHLDLSINRLDGSIPPGLGGLGSISLLDLSANGFSGTLPSSLYNLSLLTSLQVEGNALQGSIPADIGDRLPAMEKLVLSRNRFSGAIPHSVTNLSSLATLRLGWNQFSGYVPRTLGRSQDLRYLELAGNRLEADNSRGWEFMDSLANCTQLQYLALDNNSFRGQLPGSVVNLSTSLQKLFIGYNNISGEIPSDISNLAGLKVLQVANTSVSGVIPKSIGKLANLVMFFMFNNALSGLVPTSVGNLTKLNWILAYNNNLQGPIPASLGRLKDLNILDISKNRLNGSIPREIFKLSSLSIQLDLSDNSLSGPLPSEVGSLTNLNWLVLSGNQLSGKIPESISSCTVLQYLLLHNNSFEGSIPTNLKNIKGLTTISLSMNKLSGTIPDTFAGIATLKELYLAQNNLSGPIPAVLQNLTLLSVLDLSFNNLEGEVPSGGVFRNLTYESVEGNSKLCGGVHQLHLASCSSLYPVRNHKKSLVVPLTVTGSLVLLVSVIVIVWLLHRKLKESKEFHMLPLTIDKHQRVSYQAILNGTNEFSDANLLGKGRFGAVYRCTLDDEGTGTNVAVKVLDPQQSGSSKSFEVECEALRRVRHRCILKIITCCASISPQGQEFKALVFELMPNNSLDSWLHPNSQEPAPCSTLSLAQRLDIAVDILDALDYLHNDCQPPIIHCDIKPSNILLAQDMSARVGDFGIARVLPENASQTMLNSTRSAGVRGSIGYIAPEYGEGSAASPLGDVYSIGILLLEMFTGRSPTDDMFKGSLNLHKFAEAALPDKVMEIADPAIWIHTEANDTGVADTGTARTRTEECLVSVMSVGISCSMQQPRERMLIRDAASEMRAVRDAYLIFANSPIHQRK